MSEVRNHHNADAGSAYVRRPSIRPSPFNLGTTYEGARLEGALGVAPAARIERVHVDRPAGQELLELWHHATTRRGEHIWRFRARTERPVVAFAFLGMWTDTGETCTHFAFEVKAGPPPGGRVLFCTSVFDSVSSAATHANLNVMTRELRAQTNTTFALPADLSPYQVVVLHGEGLRHLVQTEAAEVRRYLAAGGRVVVLANHFFHDTVMLANHLTEPFGIQLHDREYTEVLCDAQDIVGHQVTAGVGRLRWFRPSPITTDGRARLLVRHPEQADEGFVACGGPAENLVVVGTSLVGSLVSEGWPFENGRLLANLLATDGAAAPLT